MLSLPFDEKNLVIDARYILCSRNKKLIIIKVDLLYGQNNIGLDEVSHFQVHFCRQILKVLLQSLLGIAGKHTSISKMMQEVRQK